MNMLKTLNKISFSNDKSKNSFHTTIIIHVQCATILENCDTCKQMPAIHSLLYILARFEFGVAWVEHSYIMVVARRYLIK